ncbi:MAG: hypothetical protein WCK65_02340 [Rhodospirillaceae bacterium]
MTDLLQLAGDPTTLPPPAIPAPTLGTLEQIREQLSGQFGTEAGKMAETALVAARQAGTAAFDAASKVGAAAFDAAGKAGAGAVDIAKQAGAYASDAASKAGASAGDAANQVGTAAQAMKEVVTKATTAPPVNETVVSSADSCLTSFTSIWTDLFSGALKAAASDTVNTVTSCTHSALSGIQSLLSYLL